MRKSKFFDGLLALFGVAWLTSGYQVTDSIGAAAAARGHVLGLELVGGISTVGTAVIEFYEEVFSDFPSGQGAILVVDIDDLWILQELRVESDILHATTCQGCPALESLGPSLAASHPMLNGWRQPTFGSAAVVEPCGSKAGLTGTSSSSKLPAGEKGIADLLSAVM
jgi:hypothetical protein